MNPAGPTYSGKLLCTVPGSLEHPWSRLRLQLFGSCAKKGAIPFWMFVKAKASVDQEKREGPYPSASSFEPKGCICFSGAACGFFTFEWVLKGKQETVATLDVQISEIPRISFSKVPYLSRCLIPLLSIHGVPKAQGLWTSASGVDGKCLAAIFNRLRA